MTTTSGIVLCGGRSSRMGRPKAWLPWQGRPVLAHVVDRLRAVVDEVVVVSAPDQPLPDVAARVVADETEGLGPLAGLAAGLAAARGARAFATATDAPYLTEAFVRAVLAVGGAAAPVIDGRVQPLAAAYPVTAAETAARLLAAGRRRPLDLLEALDYTPLPAEALPDVEAVRGFNTPAEYLAAVSSPPAPDAILELLGRARARVGTDTVKVRPGRLGDVLAAVADRVVLTEGDRVARPFAVSLDGRAFVRDLAVPIGPGEHVVVLDASVGG